MDDLDWTALESDHLKLRDPERSSEYYRADLERFKALFVASWRPTLERSRMLDYEREETLREKWQAYEHGVIEHERMRRLAIIEQGRRRAASPVYDHVCVTDPAHLENVLTQFTKASHDQDWLAGWRAVTFSTRTHAYMIPVCVVIPELGHVPIGEIDYLAKNADELTLTVWPCEFSDTAGVDLAPAAVALERLAERLGELYGGAKKKGKPRGTNADNGRNNTMNANTVTALTRALDRRRAEESRGEITPLRKTLRAEKVNGKATDVRTAENHLPERLRGAGWENVDIKTPSAADINAYWKAQHSREFV